MFLVRTRSIGAEPKSMLFSMGMRMREAMGQYQEALQHAGDRPQVEEVTRVYQERITNLDQWHQQQLEKIDQQSGGSDAAQAYREIITQYQRDIRDAAQEYGTTLHTAALEYVIEAGTESPASLGELPSSGRQAFR